MTPRQYSFFLLFLLNLGSLLGQGYYLPEQDSRFPIQENMGSRILGMGETIERVPLAVGEYTRRGRLEGLSSAFVMHYNANRVAFEYSDVNLSEDSGLLAVCQARRRGAWVAGYETNDELLKEGVIFRMQSDTLLDKRVQFVKVEELPNQEVEGHHVHFSKMVRLRNGNILVAAELNSARANRRNSPQYKPRLYLVREGLQGEKKTITKLNLSKLKSTRSARIVHLLPNTAKNEVTVVVDQLDKAGQSKNEYRSYVYSISGRYEGKFTEGWSLKDIELHGASTDLRDRIILTGTSWRGRPRQWLGVAPFNGTNLTEERTFSDGAFGPNAVLRGQINVLRGDYESSPIVPSYGHMDEFIYNQAANTWEENPVFKLDLPIKNAGDRFSRANFYVDGARNLWLFGQRELLEGSSYKEGYGELLRLIPEGKSIPQIDMGENYGDETKGEKPVFNDPALTIENFDLFFANKATRSLPIGKEGWIQFDLRNSGPVDLYDIDVEIGVIGKAKGIQLIDDRPNGGRGLEGVGAGQTIPIEFPISTTKELAAFGITVFRIQVFQDEKIVKELDFTIGVEGRGGNGADEELLKITPLRGAKSESRPQRSTSGKFYSTTDIPSPRSLDDVELILLDDQTPINKGKGKSKGTLTRTGYNDGIYTYKLDLSVKLKPGMNKINYRLLFSDGTVLQSDTIFVEYDKKPNLHFIGIAPDYSRLNKLENIRPLEYNVNDITNLRDELETGQTGGEMYNRVIVDLFKTPDETEVQKLRSFFEDIQRRTNPQEPGYIAPKDLLVLYFSAHGGVMPKEDMKEKEGQEEYFILPSDYRQGSRTWALDYENEVLRYVKKLKRRVVIFIDACNDPLRLKSRGGGLPPPEFVQQLKKLHVGIEGVSTIIAASPGEEAYENKRWNNGAFTEAFLEALRNQPGIDAKGEFIYADSSPADGVLTLEEIVEYLRLRVPGLLSQQEEYKFSTQTPSFVPSNGSVLPPNTKLFTVPRR